jgi:tetratricopeptide (TPR) repeat protein
MWSDQYDRDLKGILAFISDVSRQIAEELKYELSLAEKKQIEKVYTQSTEAYQLYLKGRYFWHTRTKEDLLKSIDYFNQALAIDPNYSLACAGLADAYFIMVWWKWYPWDEGRIKSKEYAMKALNIDNHLSEAHAVLGGIADWFEKDWTLAERELNLAIECNPNFAVAHQYYGEHLNNRGNFIAALDQLNKAIQLNPNAPAMYRVRAGIYYNIGKYNEVLSNTKKVSELNQYYLTSRMLSFRVYIRLGEDLKAINELKTIISINDPESDQANLLNDIYSKSGIEGIIHWTIDWLKLKDFNDNRIGLFNDDYLIASLYSFTSEWDSVMVHLERFSNSKSARKPEIKNTIDFKPLRNDPRFVALIKGMGLEDL